MNRHKWWSIIDLSVAIALGINGSLWINHSLSISNSSSESSKTDVNTLRYSQFILGIYLMYVIDTEEE